MKNIKRQKHKDRGFKIERFQNRDTNVHNHQIDFKISQAERHS